jgi:hypothetical protein
MLIALWSEGRTKFHINKGSYGYFYCNVQLCWLLYRYLNVPNLAEYYIFLCGPGVKVNA